MTDQYDDLQEMVLEDARKDFSETVIDHFMNPRNLGKIEHADGIASITGPCGDTMQIFIKVNRGSISEISFMTDGCGASIASASMTTVLAAGKSLAEAQSISQQDILNALGGLPEDNMHCALLASNTLKAAVQDYLASQ
ncbi:MAG: iron-sulfur cluster assembly scaffold protein [Dehalococcoidales bacterium]|nr:iron-sulfur cluster assembly scaffold protein [Dehalococcoidales bacterium]